MMDSSSANSRVSKGITMSKVKLLFKDFIRILVRDVLLDSFRVCKKPLYFFVPSKDFTGGDA